MWFRSILGSCESSGANKPIRSKRRRQNPRRPAQRLRLESLESRSLLTFMAPIEYGATVPSDAVAAGDFSNNGIQDLAVAGGSSLSVLMGNGDGTFQPAKTYSNGSNNAASVAVGDVTGDGKLDIVTANEGSPGDIYSGVLPVPGSVSVLMGNGDGSFKSPITFNLPAGQQPFSLALGDMNHDGRIDVVVTGTFSVYNGGTYTFETYDYVDVLLGHADGTFSLASTTLLGLSANLGGPDSVTLGDFNADGNLDVATTVGDSVAVLAGNGDGTLAPPTDFAAGAPALSVSAGDITGDGKLDLVTGNSSGSVSVLLGNGDGNFQPPIVSTLPTWNGQAQSAGAVVVGDLNRDGKMDLAVTASSYLYPNYSFNAIILLGNGEGNFTDEQIVPLGYFDHSSDGSITTADFNSDGYPDLAVANGFYGDFSVLLNGANWSATPPTATSFAVSGFASSTQAGTPGSFTVTALNPDGTVDTGYTGTVRFSSSDGQAALPAAYAFTAADAGKHTFSATLKSAGTQSITATDASTGNLTGSETGIAVTPAAASHFAISTPASSTAGNSFSVTVTALDPYNNTASGYGGTVHFTSSDGQAILPGNYTFAANDAGVHTFTSGVTLKTAGNQTLAVTDASTISIAGSASVAVNAAAASTMTVTGFPSPVTAGLAGSFTVTLKDAYGNVATGYNSTVHFTSSDAKAVLPANYTFISVDAGKHTFSATLKTAGTQSISATDTVNASLHGTDSGVTVKAAAASKFMLSAPSSVMPGVAFSLTVSVEDAYGNIVTGYVGTVHFSSSDNRAKLPANYTFTAGNNGVHSFTGLVL
ncbi:MAG: FG-GAP-like repeat-containing protein [Pirellulales bacterium]